MREPLVWPDFLAGGWPDAGSLMVARLMMAGLMVLPPVGVHYLLLVPASAELISKQLGRQGSHFWS